MITSEYLKIAFLDWIKELKNEIAAEVANHLKKELTKTPESEDKILTSTEASVLFNISKSHIIQLRKEGLPYYKIKDSVRFRKSEVDQFLFEHYRVVDKEIPP